jgi:hypothetical protein
MNVSNIVNIISASIVLILTYFIATVVIGLAGIELIQLFVGIILLNVLIIGYDVSAIRKKLGA